ncbi:MAG: M15 family metallopeptidase [Bacteroides sp.]|nr:M15 family metallopeptidase [Bacteroides sp.]
MKKWLCFYLCWLLLIPFSCRGQASEEKSTTSTSAAGQPLATEEPHLPPPAPRKSPTALYLDSIGLVDVRDLDPTIIVRLMYATADNFTGEVLYEDLREAYLQPEAAEALVRAQQALHRIHPSYNLIVYDAVRPMSVQQKMWNVVKGTSKHIYVSNPARGGGLHNYGVAVDISIADSLGHPLPMGTEVDHLGREAHVNLEDQLLREGAITREEQNNRKLLRQVMHEAGYRVLPTEWWHFDLYTRAQAKEKYSIIQ